MGIGFYFGPDAAGEDGPAVVGLLVEEFGAAVLEFAYGGDGYCAVFAIGPIGCPLAGLRVVEEQVHTFEVSEWAAGFDLFELGAALPYFSGDDGPVECGPLL